MPEKQSIPESSLSWAQRGSPSSDQSFTLLPHGTRYGSFIEPDSLILKSRRLHTSSEHQHASAIRLLLKSYVMITRYTWVYIIDPSSTKYCLGGLWFALVFGISTFGCLHQDVVKYRRECDVSFVKPTQISIPPPGIGVHYDHGLRSL